MPKLSDNERDYTDAVEFDYWQLQQPGFRQTIPVIGGLGVPVFTIPAYGTIEFMTVVRLEGFSQSCELTLTTVPNNTPVFEDLDVNAQAFINYATPFPNPNGSDQEKVMVYAIFDPAVVPMLTSGKLLIAARILDPARLASQ